MNSKIFVKGKLSGLDNFLITLYSVINYVIPIFFIADKSVRLNYIMIITFFSSLLFVASDYLKCTKNYVLVIVWVLLYIIGFIIQTYMINDSTVYEIGSLNITNFIRLPLVVFSFSIVFRILFVWKYKYEPSVYGWTDRIAEKNSSKITKKREDYILFFFGRIVLFIIIVYLNYKI